MAGIFVRRPIVKPIEQMAVVRHAVRCDRWMQVQPTDTVAALKQRILERECIPPQHLRVLLMDKAGTGKLLQPDSRTLNEYNLKSGETIFVTRSNCAMTRCLEFLGCSKRSAQAMSRLLMLLAVVLCKARRSCRSCRAYAGIFLVRN